MAFLPLISSLLLCSWVDLECWIQVLLLSQAFWEPISGTPIKSLVKCLYLWKKLFLFTGKLTDGIRKIAGKIPFLLSLNIKDMLVPITLQSKDRWATTGAHMLALPFACTRVQVCMHWEARGQCRGFLLTFPSCFWDRLSQTRLVNQWALGLSLPQPWTTDAQLHTWLSASVLGIQSMSSCLQSTCFMGWAISPLHWLNLLCIFRESFSAASTLTIRVIVKYNLFYSQLSALLHSTML